MLDFLSNCSDVLLIKVTYIDICVAKQAYLYTGTYRYLYVLLNNVTPLWLARRCWTLVQHPHLVFVSNVTYVLLKFFT